MLTFLHPVRRLIACLCATSLCATALALTSDDTDHRAPSAIIDASVLPAPFFFDDGGWARSYTFRVNTNRPADTALFFYGGSGCPDWGVVMPDYLEGFTRAADVYVLNKRHASLNVLDSPCSLRFAQRNNPDQWAVDFRTFVDRTLASRITSPHNVVLVGVSEGAVNAVRVARQVPAVTHLALIGDGGFSMRRALATLSGRGALSFDPDAEFSKVRRHPNSLTEEVLGSPNRLWSQVLDDDPLPDFMALTIPIVLAMGENDDSVPIESAKYLHRQFQLASKTNLTLLTYPNADHRLQAGNVSYRPAFFEALSKMLD